MAEFMLSLFEKVRARCWEPRRLSFQAEGREPLSGAPRWCGEDHPGGT